MSLEPQVSQFFKGSTSKLISHLLPHTSQLVLPGYVTHNEQVPWSVFKWDP